VRCKAPVTARLSEEDEKPHHDETNMLLGSRTLRRFARIAIAAFSHRNGIGGWRVRTVALHGDDFADGWGHLQQEEFAEAERAFRSVLKSRPDDAAASLYLGIAVAGQGRHAEAIAPLCDAASARPLDAEVHARLGISLRETGEIFLAMSSLREALRLRPGLRVAVNALDDLVSAAALPVKRTAPVRARSPRRGARRRPHRYTRRTMPALSQELRVGA
jgi:tetratricopeptide (TPR) repeat protein